MTAVVRDANRILDIDRSVHDWYRFVLSFPPHLVREYLTKFGIEPGQTVLDPFCGTGTTLVECKKLGIASVGIEANPMARFASAVKTDWTIDPLALRAHASGVYAEATQKLEARGISDEVFFNRSDIQDLRTLAPEQESLLLRGSISPLPLHKALILRESLVNSPHTAFNDHERLAFANCVVASASNLHFGPEVGVRKPKADAAVAGPWLERVNTIASDVTEWQHQSAVSTSVFHADARTIPTVVPPKSIDFVFTSPPYPNEKDYTRTTRLESVLLGFISTKAELRQLKQTLMRSNTRNVYKDDLEDPLVAKHPEIQRIAHAIEKKRLELQKTSGFERMYTRVTKLYFGGMAQHLRTLQPCLKPGACLAYVVGDQASYFRVLIRTGALLADIAKSLGYEVLGIDLFRTRAATATRDQLREEVVLLRWPGN